MRVLVVLLAACGAGGDVPVADLAQPDMRLGDGFIVPNWEDLASGVTWSDGAVQSDLTAAYLSCYTLRTGCDSCAACDGSVCTPNAWPIATQIDQPGECLWCGLPGAACQAGWQCCNNAFTNCEQGRCCYAPGATCAKDAECCSGTCAPYKTDGGVLAGACQ